MIRAALFVSVAVASALVVAIVVSSEPTTGGATEQDSVPSVPLLLDLHGAGGSPSWQRAWSGMDDCARRRGWHVRYPEGYGGTWNAGPGMYPPAWPARDHVASLSTLARAWRASLNASAVFVTGLSNGCAMALRLGLESDAVDAVACTSHAAHPDVAGTRRGSVPLLLLTGDADPIFAGASDVDRTLARYASHNGCVGASRSNASEPGVILRRFEGCRAPVEHALYLGGGHLLLPASRAAARMCDFFA